MKELLQSPFFIVCTIIFLSHQLAEKVLGIHIYLLDSYLDCLLFFPIVLTLITIERRFFSKNIGYKLAVFEILTIGIILSILFEEIIPLFFSQFTKDYLDYIAYALGLLMFHFFINRNLRTIFKIE
jgi:hypothetical protein